MIRKMANALGILLLSSSLMAMTTEVCVHKAIEAMGIKDNLWSDPALIDDILRNDMHLADLPGIKNLLSNKLTQSLPLDPMVNAIRSGITNKHPAIAEFLCKAHKQNLLYQINTKRIMHHMFILDDIVSGM